VDVARILCRTPEELAKTDIADYALEALRHSCIKDVYMLGRRGPAQAAFTNPELKELSELAGADLLISPEEAALDPLSRSAMEQAPDRTTIRKVEMIQDYAKRQAIGKSRRLHLRFLVSPVELLGNAQGQVSAMRLVKNELYATDAGSLRPRPTEHFETVPAGLVFRSVGYRGVPLADVPFDERRGVILNHKGRVLDAETRQPRPGEYTAGWIKRGPSGVIGTNKPDALETVQAMVDDIGKDALLHPAHATAAAALQYVREQQPHYFSYEDWRHLNSIEVTRGKALGKPRLKFTHIEDMLAARQQVVGQ
jgi:ferredoxin--NADP+ reductase